jgi:hypothetical protein
MRGITALIVTMVFTSPHGVNDKLAKLATLRFRLGRKSNVESKVLVILGRQWRSYFS